MCALPGIQDTCQLSPFSSERLPPGVKGADSVPTPPGAVSSLVPGLQALVAEIPLQGFFFQGSWCVAFKHVPLECEELCEDPPLSLAWQVLLLHADSSIHGLIVLGDLLDSLLQQVDILGVLVLLLDRL
jgi:hypothetical protein